MTKVPPKDRFDDYTRDPFEEILYRASTGIPPRMNTDSYSSFPREAYKEGLLAKVLEKAGDAVLSYAEVRQLLYGAIRDEMSKNLESLRLPFSALVAAISDQALLMNIPAIGAGIGSSMMLMFAPLFVEGAISTINKILRADSSAPVTKKEKAAETFLGSLIELQIRASAGSEIKILVPVQNKSSVSFMTKEIEQAKEEFSTLFAVAERDGLDTSSIASFKNAPEQAMAFLQKVQPGEESYILSLIGVWAVNRDIVHTILLKRPYEELRNRYNNVKNALLHDLKTPMNDEQNRQLALVEQLLISPPLLANYETIKELLDQLEESMETYKAKKLAADQLILFRAAAEIRQIASGKTNADYQYVGVMHTQLEQLAKKIEKILPKTSEELLPEQMQLLSQEIQDSFQEIKSENPYSLTMILKSHPRTLLYFLHVNSSLVEDVSMPALAVPEEKHLAGFEELIQKLSKWKSFFRYQPGVLRSILHEIKYEITSEFAKRACRVVYKAILEMLSSLGEEEASPLFEYLSSIMSEGE